MGCRIKSKKVDSPKSCPESKMWSLARIGLLILLPFMRKGSTMGKKKRKVHDPPCRNESIARVSQWIDDFISESDNFDRLVQRHIYLIDEIDHLQKQQAQSLSCGDVTVCSEDFDHDDEEVKSLHQDLESTIQDIQLQKQDLGHLVDRLNGVPEAWDYWGYWFSDEPEDRIWTETLQTLCPIVVRNVDVVDDIGDSGGFSERMMGLWHVS
uniref:tRNA threonylcarbamoyladenosine dehydratase n=2 Tax=Talaromyces marneffei PM1 TaxID=1077442 RepID=A0A093VHA2_TALMA